MSTPHIKTGQPSILVKEASLAVEVPESSVDVNHQARMVHMPVHGRQIRTFLQPPMDGPCSLQVVFKDGHDMSR